MKDFDIFIGEELSKKYPDKTWEQIMEITTDTQALEKASGKKLEAYYNAFIRTRK